MVHLFWWVPFILGFYGACGIDDRLVPAMFIALTNRRVITIRVQRHVRAFVKLKP